MFKKILIFGAGTLFGAYVMRNHIFRNAAMSLIASYTDKESNDSDTSETEKES